MNIAPSYRNDIETARACLSVAEDLQEDVELRKTKAIEALSIAVRLSCGIALLPLEKQAVKDLYIRLEGLLPNVRPKPSLTPESREKASKLKNLR